MNKTAKQATATSSPITTSSDRGEGSPSSTIRSRRLGRTVCTNATTTAITLQSARRTRMIALPVGLTSPAASWAPQPAAKQGTDTHQYEPGDRPGHHSLRHWPDVADAQAPRVRGIAALPHV